MAVISNNSDIKKAIWNKSISFLSRREYSFQELKSKLALKFPEDLDTITQVLNELKQKDFLSDKRYIQSYLNSKAKKAGLTKIRYTLRQKVADSDLIDEVLQDNPIDEYNTALALWQKKYGAIVSLDHKERAKQIRFLQNKGFSFTIINQIIHFFQRKNA